MAILDEERASRESSIQLKQGKAGSSTMYSSLNSNGKAAAIRQAKHGSFDFERRGWGLNSIHRSPSGASASTSMSAEHSRENGEGVGSTSKAANGRPKSPVQVSKPSDRLNHPYAYKTPSSPSSKNRAIAPSSKPTKPDDQPTPSAVAHGRSQSAGVAETAIGTSTNAGLSSSLGRSTGKKFGGGIARLVGLTHGPFSFEKPVPSPPSHQTFNSKYGIHNDSAKSYQTPREAPNDQGAPDGEQKQGRRRAKESRTTDEMGSTPPVVKLNRPNSLGYRSGTKGRSLDLGLGLAWAPRKIKEEALLPSTNLTFTKYTTSRNGATLPAEADRTKAGKELAQIFRSALDDDAYASFKKCK
jgi:hypothetical protein